MESVDDLSISDIFEQFVEATTMRNVLALHQKILKYADLTPCDFNVFFPKFKRAILSTRQKKNWKAKALFSKIEKRAAQRCYSNTKVPISTSERTCDISASQENCADESLSSKANNRVFINNHALQHYNCLVIGSGPAGLRTAVELQLLGASKVVVVEKRGRFSRNNVLHLWPFVIDDLKSLGAKKFYGKFCAGSIDHISIRQLQLMLLKVCLMIGCDFRDSCSYMNLCPASLKQQNQNPQTLVMNCETSDKSDSQKCSHEECDSNRSEPSSDRVGSACGSASDTDRADDKQEVESNSTGAAATNIDQSSLQSEDAAGKIVIKNMDLRGTRAHFQCDYKAQERELNSIDWDIIIGADGRRNTLSNFFPRREFRGRLAIAITANFINRQTPAETSVPEISGISYIYNQDMFNALAYDTNIELENICYYKDDTHYFVMTAKKRSLLERGVLIKDYAVTQDLLSDSNVNKEALLKYAKDAAFWTTGLEPLDFALNHYGQEDCAMFDFTSMYAASNACKALRTNRGGFTLVGLVGDSLLEPFWPTGSGCARGFLSSFDAAWMCRQWAVNKCAVLDFHGTITTKSGKNRCGDSDKSPVEPTTYDKMALSVIAERESIYRILAQTTSENLQQNYSHWTLNPHTRYPNLNRHLISPAQIEHLVATSQKVTAFDSKLLSPKAAATTSRRIKSPNHLKSRRSPKKLKSAGASPMTQPRNAKNRLKTTAYKSRSRYDISIDDDYLEFEESYRNLADTDRGGMTQYLNYKQRNSLDLDDLFIPSISGTLPSSNNLSKLEARKARDIDECLRQRRQKAKITIVREQLISQMRGECKKDENGAPLFSGGNATLFNEIKRMREQQARGIRGESKLREGPSGPLSLLNSMRRCASFAERVKSFESKLGHQDSADSSNATTPKTPIDNVKNLPQFATLQELIISNTQNPCDQMKKSRIPVTKLSKDDWNVKCWEKRLVAHKQRNLSISSKSLNRGMSVDSAREQMNHFIRPQKKVDVFQDRINEMADKLKINKENDEPRQVKDNPFAKSFAKAQEAATTPGSVRSQGWVNHLKRELAKGSNSNKRTVKGQAMNPAIPNKPIKKLFEDEEDDDGIDVNKHYDHLCVNRPTNKYLAKGAYTSHLARRTINSSTAKVINRPNVTSESKQAYLAALASRNSSASSTLSDYSTNTGNSSSGSGTKQISSKTVSVIDVECFRCKKFVSTSDRISIGSSSLHRSCLACVDCGLTLRSNEIQHYLNLVSTNVDDSTDQGKVRFLCAICKPDIRVDLMRETDKRNAAMISNIEQERLTDYAELEKTSQQRKFQSREDFLNSRINYNELYKNIISNESTESSLKERANESRSSRVMGKPSSKVPPSPVQVTIPMKFIRDTSESPLEIENEKFDEDNGRLSVSQKTKPNFRIANSTTDMNGSEQVTLILPESATSNNETRRNDPSASSNSHRVSKESEMIDEEELERILHLDNRQAHLKLHANGTSSSDGSTDEDETISHEEDASAGDGGSAVDKNQRKSAGNTESSIDQKHSKMASRTSEAASGGESTTTDEDSSSLDLPPDSDESDEGEDDDVKNMHSTCEDFITSEEFDATSDREDETTLSDADSHGGSESRAASGNGNKNVTGESGRPGGSSELPATS